MKAGRRARAVLLLYALCAIYLVPVFPHFLSANELTRWAAVAGLVENGSLEVSWATALIGPPMDVARHGRHLYSNKAPGLTFLSVPPYLLARALLGPPDTHNLRWSLWLVRVFAVTLPAIALGVGLNRSCKDDAFAAAALLFATPIFVFGSLYFAHVTAAACLYGAYLLALRWPNRPDVARRTVAAGFLAGLAVCTEYPAALGVVALGVALLFLPDRGRRVAAYVAGGAPWALALAVYNTWLFGSPFSLSSANEAAANLAEQASHGVFGVGLPTLSGLSTILASPSRGLLFFSPILVMGLVSLVPRDRRSPAAWFRLVFVVALVLAIGGYPMNHGGWGAGARYLILALPFLVEAAHDREVGPGVVGSTLLAFSSMLCVTPALTFPLVPELFEFLHASFTRPLLAAGFATPNLGSFLTPGELSLVPVAAGALAAVAIGVFAGTRRAAWGLALGLLGAAAVFFAPVRDLPDERALRALLLDTHFTPVDRLGALARSTAAPDERRQLEELRQLVPATREVGPDDWPYDTRSTAAPPPLSAPGATGPPTRRPPGA